MVLSATTLGEYPPIAIFKSILNVSKKQIPTHLKFLDVMDLKFIYSHSYVEIFETFKILLKYCFSKWELRIDITKNILPHVPRPRPPDAGFSCKSLPFPSGRSLRCTCTFLSVVTTIETGGRWQSGEALVVLSRQSRTPARAAILLLRNLPHRLGFVLHR